MRHAMFWLVLIVIAAGLPLLGRPAPQAQKDLKIGPASVSKIEGTDRVRLTLLPEAARRLDIRTAPVRKGPIVQTRRFGGEVISVSGDGATAVVQVYLTKNDVKSVRRDGPAFVLPLTRQSKSFRVKALPAKQPGLQGLSGPFGATYYEVSNTGVGLVNRQLVFVELPLSGRTKQTIIPYAAVLYDAKGSTWVYTNPEPLVFIRQPISINTIVGDKAVLRDGPPAGTAVVTVGGAELYGTEFGVGK